MPISRKRVQCILLSITVIGFALSFIAVAYATPSHYNYKVTSNYHGMEVPLGTLVTVTATTDNPNVNRVTFIWKDAGKNPIWTYTDISNSFESANTPDSLGDWGVQAFFQDGEGKTVQEVEDVVAIRATSFNAVPEIPLLGTASIAIAMTLGLAYKTKKKPTK